MSPTDMGNSGHVLVVDDDREIRDLLGRFLTKHGYRVTGARDGKEMRRALADWNIDLVVLDLMLPGEDGLSLCRDLRAKSRIPVIMLTMMGEETDRIIGLEMGADDYLPKSFNPRELLARLKAVLRRAQSAPAAPTTAGRKILGFAGWRLDLGLRRLVDDRTQMIAAISHDLGTPITRLRLQAEFVEDEEQRKKMLTNLDDMEKMVFSALSFARDEAACEPRAMVDLRTLLQRVCDDMADAGATVSLDAGDDAVAYGCRPVALRRVLTNLIDNAVKYGHQARVSLDGSNDTVLIRIDDDGPGIPEELQEDVFKPFRRLEASRNRET